MIKLLLLPGVLFCALLHAAAQPLMPALTGSSSSAPLTAYRTATSKNFSGLITG